MKKKIRYIDGDRVIINDSPNNLKDDLPDDLDFSTLKEIPNPIQSMIILDQDVAKYFKNSRQVNEYLRKQIKSLQI